MSHLTFLLLTYKFDHVSQPGGPQTKRGSITLASVNTMVSEEKLGYQRAEVVCLHFTDWYKYKPEKEQRIKKISETQTMSLTNFFDSGIGCGKVGVGEVVAPDTLQWPTYQVSCT